MSVNTRNRRTSTNSKECRACLGKIYGSENSTDLFHAWDPPWNGMGISIAEDLNKITNLQITPSDSHSKSICTECRERLQDAISFVSMVQKADLVLRKQQIERETPSWPKPIQVDKGVAISTLNLSVHVKQEILSDDECEMLETYGEQSEPRLDIKIEPEEMTLATHSVPQLSLPHIVEVTCPVFTSNNAETNLKLNSSEFVEDDEITIQDVKDEPMSEEDSDSSVSDNDGMPNDCMLCMKSFNTVKGLKAHVIAAHSYDTIIAPQVLKEHVCKTCNRSFVTRTDLSVHETCHSKLACYICDEKFDSFPQLTKHRSKPCMKTAATPPPPPPRLSTLEDVRRIAGVSGTKSLNLFDFHIPITRIKEMKLVEKSENVKAIKREQHKVCKEMGKENNGQLANDELTSILDKNVMSVIVNVRLPISECDIVAKIEPLDSDYTSTLLGYFNDAAHIKTEQHTDDEPIPNTYTDDCINTETNKKNSRKKTRISIDPATLKLIKNKNISSQPSLLQKLEDLLRSRQKHAELKRQMTQTERNIVNEGFVLKTEPELDRSKTNKQKRKRRKRHRQTIKMELNTLAGETINMSKLSSKTSHLKIPSKNVTSLLQTQIKTESINPVEVKSTQQSIPAKQKFNSLKACKMKCAKRIPIAFQQKVFEHYYSLSKWDRRRYLSTLVDRIPCNPFKTRFHNKHYLKLGTDSYSICKICLSNTLSLNYASLCHSERLLKYKTEK